MGQKHIILRGSQPSTRDPMGGPIPFDVSPPEVSVEVEVPAEVAMLGVPAAAGRTLTAADDDAAAAVAAAAEAIADGSRVTSHRWLFGWMRR